jgi:hypothetical protein
VDILALLPPPLTCTATPDVLGWPQPLLSGWGSRAAIPSHGVGRVAVSHFLKSVSGCNYFMKSVSYLKREVFLECLANIARRFIK